MIGDIEQLNANVSGALLDGEGFALGSQSDHLEASWFAVLHE